MNAPIDELTEGLGAPDDLIDELGGKGPLLAVLAIAAYVVFGT
jgi:hypothetical protein